MSSSLPPRLGFLQECQPTDLIVPTFAKYPLWARHCSRSWGYSGGQEELIFQWDAGSIDIHIKRQCQISSMKKKWGKGRV